MSLYHIDNTNVLVTKEKTALIPINFNDFNDCDALIKSLKNHDGKLQDSIVTMLRCMEATNTHTLDLSLKKIILSVNEIQSSNSISYNNELKQKLEFSLNKEKELSSEKDELLQKISLLNKEKDAADKKILELEEQLSSFNIQNQRNNEQLSDLESDSDIHDNNNTYSSQLDKQDNLSSGLDQDPDTNLSDHSILSESLPEAPDLSVPNDSSEISFNSDPDDSSNFINSNSGIFTEPEQSNEAYEKTTNFNELIHSAKFPREAKPDLSNLSPETLQEREEKENLEDMRSRLYGNDDPHSYQDNEQDQKIDEILENALNNLETNEALDLDSLYDENAKDAQLTEALKIYESLDMETYPELYKIDKNSLLQALERKLSNRSFENRIRRSASHHRPIKPAHAQMSNNTVSSGSTDITKSNTENNNNLPNSSMVFEKDEIKTIEPSLVKVNNDNYADTEDDLFNALDDLDSKPITDTDDSKEKNNITEKDLSSKSEENEPQSNADMKRNDVPSVLQSSDHSDVEKDSEIKNDPESESKTSQTSSEFNGFSSLLSQKENIEDDSADADELSDESSNEENESDDDLFTIEAPNEFLTAKEKFQKLILRKPFYIEITRKQFNEYNNLNIKESVENAVVFMRKNNWINQEV